MARPRLMLLDEPSMGLAPLVVKEIFSIIQRLNRDEGVAILLAEQNARRALAVVDHGYVLEGGIVRMEGSGAELRADSSIQRFYLGFGDAHAAVAPKPVSA
jgi:branched-chain amino acid transport system ATP-binding protein